MATREADEMLTKLALECGSEISSSQEEVLATSSFLGGDNAFPTSEDDEEVFATAPDVTQQQEEVVTMCTLPFTPTPSVQLQSKSPAAPSPDADDEDVPQANPRRKPRVGTRKVRDARIRTPSPSPEQHQQQPQAEQPEQQPQTETHADPLVRAVLMMPTTTTKTTRSNQYPVEDFLALCRLKGLI